MEEGDGGLIWVTTSGFSWATEETHEKPSKVFRPPNSQKEVLLSTLSQRWESMSKRLLGFYGTTRHYRVHVQNGPHVLKLGIGTILFIAPKYCHFSRYVTSALEQTTIYVFGVRPVGGIKMTVFRYVLLCSLGSKFHDFAQIRPPIFWPDVSSTLDRGTGWAEMLVATYTTPHHVGEDCNLELHK